MVFRSVKQQLERAQQRMKVQADKHRTKRVFQVGDSVFLKLQPYIQASVAPRANHKLAYKFYGPYRIVERVGEVTYRLDMPTSCKVHPVFHVSLLRKVLKPEHQVLPALPSPTDSIQIPKLVLQRRVVTRGAKKIPQALIQWSDSSADLATWEDLESLKQMFPRAPAWGQASSQQGGIVSDNGQATRQDEGDVNKRPTRKPRLPTRLAGP